MVIVYGPRVGDPDEHSLLAGREQVRHLVRITRELAEFEGELPRLFVVTRQAQIVKPHDSGERANLEQAGLRGLLRVISSEHPMLRTTLIDVDEHTDVERVAQQLLSGSEEDETAWRNGDWYVARLTPVRWAMKSGAPRSWIPTTTVCGCRSAGRETCKRWNSLRVTEFRPAPGKSKSRSACPASTSPTF